MPPESIGNARKLLVSNQAGRSNILAELARIGMEVDKDDPRLGGLLDEVKTKEALGYAYEAAGASFELLARRAFGQVPEFFDVESFRVMVERRHNAKGELVTVSDAIVKVRVGGELRINAGEGNGPVHALDQALQARPRHLSAEHRDPGAGGFQGAYPHRGHGRRDARPHREPGPQDG